MSAMGADARVAGVLLSRDLRLFARQRSRILGAIAQPLLLWLAIGAGIAPSFRMGSGNLGYMTYFFPGIVLMLILQNAISATMSVIEDRHQGFLQGVLVAPGSRAALVIGKCAGATAVGLLQSALLLALAPLAGFPYGQIHWGSLAVVLAMSSLALCGLGFAIAWWLDSTAGYHVVMSLVLFPLWILSGALFPAGGLHPILGALVHANPMTYAVAWTRRAMHGGAVPDGSVPGFSFPAAEWAVVAAACLLSVVLAVWACRHRPPAGH